MIVLIGKTCSGKTTIANELMKSGFHKIITTTSRGIRNGEIQDIDYHFVKTEEFLKKIRNHEFAEWKRYDSAEGPWYYGTSYSDIEKADDKSILIITPDGLKDLLKMEYKIVPIYIYANNNTIRERLLKRGDERNEAERRIRSDNEKFKYAENIVDKIVYNNSTDKIENVVSKIIKYIGEKL